MKLVVIPVRNNHRALLRKMVDREALLALGTVAKTLAIRKGRFFGNKSFLAFLAFFLKIFEASHEVEFDHSVKKPL